MVTVKDIETAIRQSLKSSADAWKVQKLAYYSQAWALAWTGKPLFASEIEAWRDGPVCPDLRKEQLYGIKLSSQKPGAHDIDVARAIVASVVAHYGGLTRQELVDLTHAEAPWRDVYRPHLNCSITFDAMRRFYSRQSIDGTGPIRPTVIVQPEISDEEFTALASAAVEEWQETLEILAR